MFHLTLFFIAHLFAVNLVISTEKVDLELETGILRGFRHRVKENAGEIAVFFGVPYARPPVGELRFQKPLPLLKWSGILSAEKPKSVCIYHAWPESWGKGKKTYGEDCLYMNIFAPFPLNSTQNGHPILVIIHGGGFEVGSSHDYKNFDDIGAKFVAKGILVASIDYRLGWIGFGSSDDGEMPGNLGLFDQLAALKFLHKNIRHFGGDPTRITLYGYSAGSASVSMHGVSPHSRELFSQAIQMSGSPFSAWALNERTVNETRALARELGCPREGSIRQCLGQKGVQKVWTAVGRIGTTRFDDVNFSKWSPRVDGDFLPADFPLLLANATPKPTLMGFVDLESLSWTLFTGANNTLAAFAIPWNEMEKYGRGKFEQFVENLVAKREFYGELAEKVKAEIVGEYLKEDGLEMLSGLNKWRFPHYYLQRYTQVLSDLNFIVPILMELKQKTALNWPIHFYQNVHYNPKEFPDQVKVHQNFHTNDENFLFHEAHFPLNFEPSEEDKMMEANLVEMFVNFIKFGNPSTNLIEWLPANKTKPTRHLRIMANPRMQNGLDGDLASRFAFWQKIVQKYGQIWDPVRGAKGKELEK